jgi:hypothetical protein
MTGDGVPATDAPSEAVRDEVPATPTGSGEITPPPWWRTTGHTARQLVGRHPAIVALAVAVVAVLVGLGIGRSTGPTPELDARVAIESSLVPLAVDADGIWSSSSDVRAPVSEALVALRRDGDTALVEENHAAWIEAYDAVIVRIAGLDLPAAARPVQRQIIASVTLSRDAVEVLAHAAAVDDPVARRDLTTEVGRLRTRSEQLAQSARASLADLGGQRADVSPLSELTSFLDGRRS